MKAIEQYFDVVLFIMLHKVVLTVKSVDENLVCDHSNESYWAVFWCGTVYYAAQGGSDCQVCGWKPSHVVLVTLLYKVVLTFKSVDETLVCDHSNESYWAVFWCGTVYYAAQGGSNCQVCGWKPSHVVLITLLYKVVLTLKVLNEALVCDHSNESYWAVLSYCYISTLYMYMYLIN